MKLIKTALITATTLLSLSSFAADLSGVYLVRSCEVTNGYNDPGLFLVYGDENRTYFQAGVNDTVEIKQDSKAIMFSNNDNVVAIDLKSGFEIKSRKISFKLNLHENGCSVQEGVGCYYSSAGYSLQQKSNGDIIYKRNVVDKAMIAFIVPYYSATKTKCELVKLNK